MMTDEQFELAIDYDTSFSQSDAPEVIKNFVCGVCHGELVEVYVPHEGRVLVICIEHGNVCDCGRVTHATVSIELERSFKRYYSAVRALPEFWGGLIAQGFDRNESLKVIKSYVCAVCGSRLIPYARIGDANVDIHCISHGNINTCGYVQSKHFVYNFQAIRAWERNHKKGV